VVRGDGVGVAVLQRSRLGGSTRSRETYLKKFCTAHSYRFVGVAVGSTTRPHTNPAPAARPPGQFRLWPRVDLRFVHRARRAATALLRRGLHALNHMPHYGPRRVVKTSVRARSARCSRVHVISLQISSRELVHTA
jgi:hypothetical protein